MSRIAASPFRLSRRSLAGASAGTILAHLQTRSRALASPASFAARGPAVPAGAAAVAGWHTWLLTAPDELRPPAPADPTAEELDEVVSLQAGRDDAAIAAIARWTSRPAVLPWSELGNAALDEFFSPVRQYRANGLLQAAMYDAVVAAYDAQTAHQRPAPATLDDRIEPLATIGGARSSFPSAEAAVAGAAATVLTALMPDAAPGRFTDLADEATTTLLQAGVAVRSDVVAGLALGRTVGERAIAVAQDDRFGDEWDGSGRLTGPGSWEPTPPDFVDPPPEPLAATWHCWILTSGDQFRPAPPPAVDSPAWHSQLSAVREAVGRRTMAQARAADFWQSGPATITWNTLTTAMISRHGLDLPHAARALALTGIAIADAEVAAWDAKYTYWTARPITVDPHLDLQFDTPPFPSFPSAHAAVSNAAAVVLAHLFPNDELDVLALATEAAASRAWAGIHFPIDNDAGQLLGRQVGYLLTDLARQDGAESE